MRPPAIPQRYSIDHRGQRRLILNMGSASLWYIYIYIYIYICKYVYQKYHSYDPDLARYVFGKSWNKSKYSTRYHQISPPWPCLAPRNNSQGSSASACGAAVRLQIRWLWVLEELKWDPPMNQEISWRDQWYVLVEKICNHISRLEITCIKLVMKWSSISPPGQFTIQPSSTQLAITWRLFSPTKNSPTPGVMASRRY